MTSSPTTEQKPAVYFDEDDDIWCFRASSLGWCEAALAKSLLGYEAEPPPSKIAEKMAESSDLEDEAITRYIQEKIGSGVQLRLIAQERVSFELDIDGQKVRVVGHTDHRVEEWIGENVVDSYILEAKSLGKTFYEAFKAGDFGTSYLWQVSSYYYGTGLHIILFAMPKFDAEDEDGNKVKLPLVSKRFELPPVTVTEIEEKIRRVFSYYEKGIPPECKGTMYPCPFWKFHIKPEETDVVDVDSDEYLVGLIEEYRELKDREAGIKRQLGEVKEERQNYERELFAWMKNNGDVSNVRIPGVVVRKVTSHSSSPDWDAMKEDGIDVDRYKRRTYYSYGKITRK